MLVEHTAHHILKHSIKSGYALKLNKITNWNISSEINDPKYYNQAEVSLVLNFEGHLES